MTRGKAIKAHCRECAGGSYAEVLFCHIVDCPLYCYRTGYSAQANAKSLKAALEKHPNVAKELLPLLVDTPFSLAQRGKVAMGARKSARTIQTTQEV
jgi:hypothetical protein